MTETDDTRTPTADLGVVLGSVCLAVTVAFLPAGAPRPLAVVGGILDFSIWGFSRGAVVVSLCVLRVAATAIAWYRQRRVRVGERAPWYPSLPLAPE